MKKQTLWTIGGGVLLLILASTTISLLLSQSSSTKNSIATTSFQTRIPIGEMMASDTDIAPEESLQKSIMPILPPEPSITAGETAAEVDQRIIKNGYLTLVVKDVPYAVSQITDLADTDHGFVQNSSISENKDGTHKGKISIRIPVKEFDRTMDTITSYALAVSNQSSTGQDVTEQFTDLQAQLHNAEAQEQVYLEILKKAETIQDVLMVQQQLGSIRGTIESLQGRIKYLENVTAYSTISVSLSEEASVQLPTKGFRPLSIFKEAIQTLIALFQSAAAGTIWLLVIGGGILLPLGLMVWALVRLARGRTAHKK
ncbi:MAG: hypothetical protein UU48_C0012G0016 [Candidatus Uhrbacteria bacterium GW2011_GWF2_41_16]|jgi:hypothetical protein|uniref:DUF4349 domain-containing protein n=1 Tax=Candidatus Uhrbacteria bacterium GW2011_GWF2_41_16 TaxID=1618997 RepID=A0A0G0YB96_9BACT|nr:MAG: hypothetical protein UU48_C0012G0016 [Candidatus Uhrbacteria bacterium GW2011_GWF2_41_16]